MRRFLTIGGVAAALALLLGSMPAQAGEVGWADTPGDAHPQGNVAPLGEPISEPAYDIVTTALSSNGTELKWVAQIAALAAEPPPRGTGVHYSFTFVLGPDTYSFSARQDRVSGSSSAFQVSGVDGLKTLDCGKCVGKIDLKTNQVVFTAPIESVGRAVRGHGTEGGFGPGTEMTGLLVRSGPLTPGLVHYHDTAPAPEGAKFTV